MTNAGAIRASEIPQLYLGFPSSAGEPPKQLKGFKVVTLASKASQEVAFTLNDRSISIWDVAARKWSPQKGTFQVYVGASSRDIKLTGSFTV